MKSTICGTTWVNRTSLDIRDNERLNTARNLYYVTFCSTGVSGGKTPSVRSRVTAENEWVLPKSYASFLHLNLQEKSSCSCKNLQDWDICFACILATAYKLSVAYCQSFVSQKSVSIHRNLCLSQILRMGVVTPCVMCTAKHCMEGISKRRS